MSEVINRITKTLIDCSGPCGRKGLNPSKDFYTRRNRHGEITVLTHRAKCKECTRAQVAGRHREVMEAKKKEAHQ